MGDLKNYNEPVLKYTSTVVMDKEKCLSDYNASNAQGLRDFNSILCTFEEGNLDEDGIPLDMDDFCYDCEDTTVSH